MSFGMYWAHRALHEVPCLWKHVHSIHHWAKHPLSRNTCKREGYFRFTTLPVSLTEKVSLL